MQWLTKMAVGVVLASALGACTDDAFDDGNGLYVPPLLPSYTLITEVNTPLDAQVLYFDDLAQGFVVDSATAGPHKVEIITNDTLHITPMEDFEGTFDVNFSVTDHKHPALSSTISIQVLGSGINRPVAEDQSVTLHRFAIITLGAHGGTYGASSYTIGQQPAHGSLSGTPPMVTYTANAGYTGDDSFTFTASDFLGMASKPATVHVTVTEGSAPTAQPVFVTVSQDSSASIQLVGSDPDNDPLIYTIPASPAHGQLTGYAPNLMYVPSAGYVGSDSFTYGVDDGLHKASATVSITVAAVNHSPTADDQDLSVNEDTPLSITLTGSDPDGDSIHFEIVSQPLHGAPLTQSNGIWTYTPNLNFAGTDSFTFRAVDAGGKRSTAATVTIHIAPVDDPPTAVSFSASVFEDTATPIALRGSDPDGDALSFAITGQPAHGALTGAPPAMIYTPDANYNGDDSFSYTVTANGQTSATATVSITVTPVDDAPVATAATVQVVEDTPIAITLAATDIDNDAATLTYSIFTPPAHGSLTGTPPNVTYTPAKDYAGTDSFQFRANDGSKFSAPATISITVTPVNDPPTPADDYAATDPGQALTFDVLGNDTDPDGDTLVIDSADAPAHGSIEIAGGKLTYTPDDGFTGLETFAYTVADPSGATATATVHMGVGPFPAGAPTERLDLTSKGLSIVTPELAPVLSGDGRFIAFSTLRALVSDDTNNVRDVYLYDRGRRELKRISVASDGTQGNGDSQRPAISNNGRYVVYESTASNLVADDHNGVMDVFRFDRITGQTNRISVATGGGEGSGASSFARISDDGDTVAFLSESFELVANDANGARDAFVRTISSGITERVSLTTSGGEADATSNSLALSSDGHTVAFETAATNLVADDHNRLSDEFVRDRVHGTTTRVSVSSTGGEADAASRAPSLSSDGRFVLFTSTATNLVPGVTGTNLYVRDTAGGTTLRASTTGSSWGALSGDGRYLAQLGSSSPLIVDRFAARSQSVVGGTLPAISANGRYVVSALDSGSTGLLVVVPNPL